MNINLAKHYGMCFGVRDALRSTHDLASERKLTVLGELVHSQVGALHEEGIFTRRAVEWHDWERTRLVAAADTANA